MSYFDFGCRFHLLNFKSKLFLYGFSIGATLINSAGMLSQPVLLLFSNVLAQFLLSSSVNGLFMI